MALSFGGSGFSAQKSINYMSQSKSLMDKSLERIASGKRLVNGADDSAGLSVAMKLKNSIATNGVAKDRVENAKSFVGMQASTLESASDIIIRMQVVQDEFVAAGSRDVANTDQEAQEAEFDELYDQLRYALGSTRLNGVAIFGRGDITVQTSPDSSSGVAIENIDYEGLILPNSGTGQQGVSGIDSSDSDLDAALTRVTSELTRVGGDQSVLEFASDHLSSMTINLESAHGRIMDLDIAEESANFAKHSMQFEAAATAVAQANVAMEAVLDLLLGSINKD